mmetsp:Transcript_36181/g.56512  ORF Transcript_36181/g.56512 Transcript_36181/m.56512 type:complete len:196 (+) Transcript_36181:126-713(+)
MSSSSLRSRDSTSSSNGLGVGGSRREGGSNSKAVGAGWTGGGKVEETLEDILIFQEWLRESHSTIKWSRRIHICYLICLSFLGLASLSWLLQPFMYLTQAAGDNNTYPTTWWEWLVAAFPFLLSCFLLLFFWISGAYHLRVRMAGAYTDRINTLLSPFSIFFCADTGRLRISSPARTELSHTQQVHSNAPLRQLS